MALFTLGYLGIDRKYAVKLMRNQHISPVTIAQFHSFLDMENLYNDLNLTTGSLNNELYHTSQNFGPVDEELAELMKPLITNPDNFPLMAESVANLPPALVMTMGLDPLCDEGLLYLRRLQRAGVKTEHYHDDICWHGAMKFDGGRLKFECGDRLVLRIIKYIQQYSDKA